MRQPKVMAILLLVTACGDDGPSGASDRRIRSLGARERAGVPLDTLAEPLQVQVTDLEGRPLAGVEVT